MIGRDEVFPIGFFYKTHGVAGELAFSFTSDVFERTKSPYFIIDMDGILVPFFIESVRLRSDRVALIKFEGIDDDRASKEFVGKEVFYPCSYAGAETESDEEEDWNELSGYRVINSNGDILGEITGIDDSTINVLLLVTDGEREIQIPAAGDYFTGVDKKKRVLHVDLPEGYLDIWQ